MGPLPLNSDLLAAAIALVGLGLAAAAARALSLRRREAALGRLVAVDAGDPLFLRSERYRLRGRPDAVREQPDGRWVPVELKSRPVPRGGPTRSHMVQVWAYCLLVEETTGRSPPVGVLRYSDGEFRIRWDDRARSDLLAIRRELDRPYDGRASPSPSRCARCPWAPACDVRAAAP